MRQLYHYPLCPFSRQVRLLLKEYGQEFNLVKCEYWLRDKELLNLNPAGELPVMVEEDGGKIVNSYSIIEYLNDENIESNLLLPDDLYERAEMRRLISWFNKKFYREVSKYILDEKVIKLLMKVGYPNSQIIRVAKSNQQHHFNYISKLLAEREYIAGEELTVADLVAAAHLSILDFLDEIMWESYPKIKNWYALIKSRPSFRKTLEDKIPGFTPPPHYIDLDF